MVSRLIASSAIASPTVEPVTAISVVTMVSVSERSVVAACSPTSTAPTTETAGAKDEDCDHYHHDYDQNRHERSHPNSPFAAFPGFRLQLPGSTTPL
jgi:hypothetical protein